MHFQVPGGRARFNNMCNWLVFHQKFGAKPYNNQTMNAQKNTNNIR